MAGALATGNRCRLSVAQKLIPAFPGNDFDLTPDIVASDAAGQTYFEWNITGSTTVIDRSNTFSKHNQSTTSMTDGTVTISGYIPLEYLMGIQVGTYYILTIEQHWNKTVVPAEPASPYGKAYRNLPFIVSDLSIGASVKGIWSVLITGKIQYVAATEDPFDDPYYIKKDAIGLGYTPRTGNYSEFPYNIDSSAEEGEEIPLPVDEFFPE